MEPFDHRHYRFLRHTPEAEKFIPLIDNDPPPLEVRYRALAGLIALLATALTILLFVVG